MKDTNNPSDKYQAEKNLEIQKNAESSNTSNNNIEVNLGNINVIKNLALDDILSHLVDDDPQVKPIQENNQIPINQTNNLIEQNSAEKSFPSNNINSFSPYQGEFAYNSTPNNEIKANPRGETNYETLFNQSSSPKKKLRASLSIEDLKNDENILIKSIVAPKDEFLKIEDLDINLEQIESAFQEIESSSKSHIIF
jgi:hypothetical protein